ncbi:Ig-like domain-containing protein [Listeria sp. SHR_NRA_18]|uniref:Ig-like domain-containing protein n=1 Tax=Listeria sp. SHR_NRA_18 TaxID=2269046 RepID=UPI001375197C|nr:Ig-like domain-containing protein [Listeria sp. SHR_NRA_18]
MAESKMKVKVASYLGVKKIVRIINPDTNEVMAIGGQRSSTMNKTADTIDVSTKTGGILNYYDIMKQVGVAAEDIPVKPYNDTKEYIQGLKDWSVDVDGALPSSDAAFDYLDEAYNKGGGVVIVSEMDFGRMRETIGIGIITDMSEDGAQEDLVSYKLSLTGTGQVVQRKIEAPTTLTATALSVKVNEKKPIVLTAVPATASKAAIFVSMDTTIATVDSAGTVTGVKAGTVDINYFSSFDTTIKGVAKITVTTP